jgi:hypothetical protein
MQEEEIPTIKKEDLDSSKVYTEDKVSVKVAANESYKRNVLARNVGLMGIGGIVISTIFTTIGSWAGAAAAAIFCFFIYWMTVKAFKDAAYLKRKYNIR